MKRKLLFLLCASALTAFGIRGFEGARAAERYAPLSQEQKEAKNYDVYVGQYEVSPGFILTVTHENDKLMGQPTGDEKAEFKAEAAPDEFYSSVVNAHLKFAKDSAGVVIAVVVKIDGKDYYSRKIK
jgi:hypothetical protein